MEEIWKPVEGFGGRVEVSNLGKFSVDGVVRNYDELQSGGKLELLLGGARKSARLHVEVAKAFLVGDAYRKFTIHFISGDVSDCSVINLRLIPRKGLPNRKTTTFDHKLYEHCKVLDIGLCKLYVSESGDITNMLTGTTYSHSLVRGYAVVHVNMAGASKSFKVHRLVAQAWLDNLEDLPVVNHIDGNKLNNHRTNLEWSTYAENTRHAIDTGLFTPEPPKICKVSEGLQSQIRQEFDQNTPYQSCLRLSRKFGLSLSTVYRYGREI